MCIYIGITRNLKRVKTNSLHFITCSIALYVCTHMRAYDGDVTQRILWPKRKASKDPLEYSSMSRKIQFTPTRRGQLYDL
jgi:hypothetical protein